MALLELAYAEIKFLINNSDDDYLNHSVLVNRQNNISSWLLLAKMREIYRLRNKSSVS